MQGNSRYQSLVKGEATKVNPQELIELENYCIDQSILPECLIRVAISLYRSNKEQAYHFLQSLADNSLEQKYQDPYYNKSKIRLYNSLVTLALGKATRTTQVQIADYWLLVAKKYLILAEAIEEMLDYNTILNRAIIYFYEGQVNKAINLAQKFEEVLDNKPENKRLFTSSLVLLAQCYFAKRNYQKSLEHYKKCLLINKCLSTNARLGMAYCYFNLNRFQMSKVCFQRILQLDPLCTAALIGLGLVHERNQEYGVYLKYVKTAFKINRKQPLTLYLIAQHYFVTNQLQKCSDYCKRGLKYLTSFAKFIKKSESFRCDYNELHGRFINLQGQIQHKNNNIAAAIELYSTVAEKDLLWNDISLVQCLIRTKNYQQGLQRMEFTYRVYEREKKDSRFLKDSYRLMAYLKRKCIEPQEEQKNSLYYYNEAIKYDKNDIELKWQLSYLLTTKDPHKARRITQQVQKLTQTNNIELSPQMFINIGVLALINHQPQLGEQRLRQALELISKWDDLDEIQHKGFMIIAKYNFAFCLESLNNNYQALQIYDSIIRENKFHLQSYLRKAYVMHKLGNYQQSSMTLANAQRICKRQSKTQHLVEDIQALKAYLLYQQGKCDQSRNVLAPILQSKPQNIYYKVLELAIRYTSLIRSQNNYERLLQLFLEGKEYCQSICEKDSNAIFCFMVLITFLASIKQLTKQQGIMAFKSISLNANQFPSIRYNTGLYFMCEDDEQAALSCFNQYKDFSQSNKANELISYLYLIHKDYKKSIKQIRKNILLDPSNIKYRAQLAYASQARCQDDYNSANSKVWMIASQEIKNCLKFYYSFKETELYRFTHGSQEKQEILLNMRAVSQQKAISAQALIDKFQKKKIQMYPKGCKLANTESESSQAEEDRIDRETQLKRKRALALVKVQTDKFRQAWELLNEKKAKENQQLKRKPQKCKEVQELSAPTKKQNIKKKKEDPKSTIKQEPEDYYEVRKDKNERLILVRKQEKKQEESNEMEQNLKNYLL